MKSRRLALVLVFPLLTLLLIAAGSGMATAEEPPPTEASGPAEAVAATDVTEPTVQELLRSFIHLQEQVHETQLAIERTRSETERAADKNASVISGRLQGIETSLADARNREFEALRASNRQMLTMAGVFAMAGFLALALTSWLQWRTVSRLGELATNGGQRLQLPGGALGALANATPSAVAGSNARLMAALRKLERRISMAEHDPVHLADPGVTATAGARDHQPDDGGPVSTSAPTSAHTNVESVSDPITAALDEGQKLLAQNRPKDAISRFDQVLALRPAHAEALLRMGAAYEQMSRMDEAIEYYDRAIEADRSLTMAYLHKGGLYNRLERFSEAMECYEQALEVQEGRAGVS